MRDFATLYRKLDQTTSTNRKLEALTDYFRSTHPEDRLWAVALFTHRRPRRTVNTALLRSWASEISGIPPWLLEESYHIVGDLAETLTLILPEKENGSVNELPLAHWVNLLMDLREADESEKKRAVTDAWSRMESGERFVFNKLITGGFRVGVSERLVIRALAACLETEETTVALRIAGEWSPRETTFSELLEADRGQAAMSRPYPFYLAYPLEGEPEKLGDPGEWQAERKWDGIRGQVVIRGGQLFTWTRGNELATAKYPEFHPLAEILDDGTVMDGEILPFREGIPLPFRDLQTRIGRKNLSRNLLERTPVVFMAYDLLELRGEDIRSRPLSDRRKHLEEVVAAAGLPALRLSEPVAFAGWDELSIIRSRSREHQCEGLMLKRVDSPYRDGRKRGDWWKWKVDPMVIDAVMIYAMRGHGRRSNLYTDYTFAVWDGDRLVPFAKAYSGLTDKEILEVDRFVKQHTRERFGPVRSVDPELVFELAFEGINRSTRHKSGLAVRFPRIHRWRRDKKPGDANTLEDLKSMIPR